MVRKLTREEFEEIIADAVSEREALAAGRPVPKATARRRPRPRPVVNLPPPPKVRKAPVAANDNPRPAPTIAAANSTPNRIPNALAKTPRLANALARLRELARPAEMSVPDMVLAAANTKAKDDTGIGLDYRHDVDPGDETDLIAAFADGMRTRVVVSKSGRVDRYKGGITYHRSVRGSGEIVEVGGRSSLGKFFGLRAHRGAITAYAKNGKRVTPSYDIGDPRGADDAELPRETTAATAAHPVLAEIDRRDDYADFLHRVPAETRRMLDLALNADNFQEVARAANMTPTAHNGRRITEKILVEAEKLLAA